MVTGGNSGVGYEVVRLLYVKNAKVYVATRNPVKAAEAIQTIKEASPSSAGQLEFLAVQLDDLKSVAAAARDFLAKESRLDVLFNNAGIMHPPAGSQTVQGHELQLGVHNLGHGLLTEMLTPLLAQTVRSSPEGSVRVVWASSLYAELSSPRGGFDASNMGYKKIDKDKFYKYAVSKAGVFYQGAEYARRHKQDGIVSVVGSALLLLQPLWPRANGMGQWCFVLLRRRLFQTANPGNLKSNLQRHVGWVKPFTNLLLYPAVNGAYTELYAALSPDVTMEESGRFGKAANILLPSSQS
jgi:retinol dehydrogenase 12